MRKPDFCKTNGCTPSPRSRRDQEGSQALKMPGRAISLSTRTGRRLQNQFVIQLEVWRSSGTERQTLHTFHGYCFMPTTHSSLHVHVIFATKNRAPLLTPELIEDVHGYIGGTLRSLDCKPVAVGGVEDHVHLLLGMKPVHRLADVMRETKKTSSIWMNERTRGFAWQQGYSAFGVSAHEIPMMVRYISHQQEHHRKKTLVEELSDVYRLAGIPFEPGDFE